MGPFGIALQRQDSSKDLRDVSNLGWMTVAPFIGATTAMDIFGAGGVMTDWSDDNPHIAGEGIYGLAFYYASESVKPALKWAYDRLMGTLSPNGANWDSVRNGTFWSILLYPDSLVEQNPLENWDWHQASLEPEGIGVFTYRDAYDDADDTLIQFKARLRVVNGHDAPDGLGFRVIGKDEPFVIGGGRELPGRKISQATVYPAIPSDSISSNFNGGSLVGTPLLKANGGGHVIAQMSENNVGTNNHKRWFVADYDSAETGADATIIVADTTTNGQYWQLPTFLGNTVTTNGNTFTITGVSGASLKGTILHPGGTPTITVTDRERGSHYGLLNGGELSTESTSNPRIEEDRCLAIQSSGDGDFLVVMTLSETGSHPAVSYLSGGVGDAVVSVGSKQFSLQTNTVLYDNAAYSAPDATITFNAGANGSITSGQSVQTVSYGASAAEPTISPAGGYIFSGWDKAFDKMVKSMTVTALYGNENDIPTAPNGLAATAISSSSIFLNWNDNSSNETGFAIDRSLNGSSWSSLSAVGVNVESFTDTNLTQGTTYYYRVRATGVGGDSGYSATGSATPTTSGSNVAPVANNDFAQVDEGSAVTVAVLSNDSDDGFPAIPGSLSIDSFTQGSNGSVSQSGSDLVYTPDAGFAGNDSFTYILTDGELTDNATVSITINAAVTGTLDFGNLSVSTFTDPDPVAQGNLLLDDNMDYGSSDLSTPINGNWSAGTNKASYESDQADDLAFTNPAYRDDNIAGTFKAKWSSWRGSNRIIGSSLTDEFWVSAILVDVDGAGIMAIGPSTSSGNYSLTKDAFGIGNDNGTLKPVVVDNNGSNQWGTRSLLANTAYLAIAKLTVGSSTDTISLWIKAAGDTFGATESSLGTPDVVFNSADFGDSVGRLYLGSNLDADASFDDLRVSDSAGDAGLGAILGVSSSGSFVVEDSGSTLHLDGNGWFSVPESYTITANTFLEFDFKADPEGEIHGIGLDDGTTVSFFQVYGSPAWASANTDYHDYATGAPAWKSYSIPVGTYLSGSIAGLVFANDDDASNAAQSWFRNVRLVEVVTNSAPVAMDDNVDCDAYSSVNIDILANDSDSDPSDTLSVDSYTQGSSGSVSQSGNNLIYTPNYGFVGNDSFTYTVTDGIDTDTATVTVSMSSVPTSFSIWISNPSYGLAANDQDVYDDADTDGYANLLEYVIGTDPGTADSAGVFSVTLDSSDYIFQFGLSNDAPDTSYDVEWTDDLGGTWQSVGGSQIQMISNQGDYSIYEARVPRSSANHIFFRLRVFLDSLSDNGTTSANLENPNIAPDAVNESTTMDQGTTVSIAVLLNDTDDGYPLNPGTLSIDSFTQGANGTVSQSGSNLVYTPDSAFTGIDSFTYTVTDGDLSDTAIVSITVNGMTILAVDFGSSTINALADPDPVASGILVLYDNLDYGTSDLSTPINSDWAGGSNKASYESDSADDLAFVNAAYRDDNTPGTFKARWVSWRGSHRLIGSSLSGVVWVSAILVDVNGSGIMAVGPNSGGNSYSLTKDAFGIGNNGGSLQPVVVDKSGSNIWGSRSLSANTAYLAIAKIDITSSADSISLWIKAASDTFGATESSLGTPDVVFTSADFGSSIDRLYLGSTNDADARMDDLRVSDSSGDAGLASILSVAPASDFYVEDSGNTLHLDGNGWFSVSQAYTITANTFLEFDFKADPEGEIQGIGLDDGASITFFQLFGTQSWSSSTSGYFDYSASAPAWKSYSIPLAAYLSGNVSALVFGNDDDAGQTAEAWFRHVRFVERSTNHAPVAVDDSVNTYEGISLSIDVLANDTDEDPSDLLSIDSFNQAINGSVQLVNGELEYTPDNGFYGLDSFTYVLSDGTTVDTGLVEVNVLQGSPNNPPVAVNDSATTDEGVAVMIAVLANDSDADSGDTLSIYNFTQPSNGSVTQSGSGLVYTPASGFFGNDSFSYTVSDSTDTDTATVSIVVNEASSAWQQSTSANNLVVFEAEDYDLQVTTSSHQWNDTTAYAGYSGTGAVEAGPDTGALNNSSYVTSSPRLDYVVNFVTTGTHYIWLRCSGPNGNGDSAHAGLDGQAIASADRISMPGSSSFAWRNSTMDGAPATIDVTTTGPHTINIWMREDGARVDKIVLTTSSNYDPDINGGLGPDVSSR